MQLHYNNYCFNEKCIKNFYENNESAYDEVTLEPSILTPFSSNIAVVPADRIESVPLENAGAGLLIDINKQVAEQQTHFSNLLHPPIVFTQHI